MLMANRQIFAGLYQISSTFCYQMNNWIPKKKKTSLNDSEKTMKYTIKKRYRYNSSIEEINLFEEAMGLFSISDLIISLTLFLNAAALLSRRTKKVSGIEEPSKSNPPLHENDALLAPTEEDGSQKPEEHLTIRQRYFLLVETIHQFSGVIVVWNIFFAFLMIFVFRG